jgi:hypothetical protein
MTTPSETDELSEKNAEAADAKAARASRARLRGSQPASARRKASFIRNRVERAKLIQ